MSTPRDLQPSGDPPLAIHRMTEKVMERHL